LLSRCCSLSDRRWPALKGAVVAEVEVEVEVEVVEALAEDRLPAAPLVAHQQVRVVLQDRQMPAQQARAPLA
jgi:hypothetical protein